MTSPAADRLLTALCALLLLPGHAPAAAQELAVEPPAADDLALMGTIPIYWGEQEGLGSLLAPSAAGHWARPVIEARWRLRPVSYLSAAALAGHTRLLLAQPRGLSPEENVALDEWVRAGGRVLLFADPLMTGESRFALGDRRRPQDVALLSPILRHWGLDLQFDSNQPPGRRIGDGVPVEQAGALVVVPGEGGCSVASDGIIATCQVGAGEALVVADAALFDTDKADLPAQSALEGLLGRIFGNPVPQSDDLVE